MAVHYETDKVLLLQGDCLQELAKPEFAEQFDLVLFDPPPGQNKVHRGISGWYSDLWETPEHYLNWLTLVCSRMRDCLKPEGQMLIHMEPLFAHESKVLCFDRVFGRQCFGGEIITYTGMNRPSQDKWSQKHNFVFHYNKDPLNAHFNYDKVRMASSKLDVSALDNLKKMNSVQYWPIMRGAGFVPGFPQTRSQALYEMLIEVHSRPGDTVLDPTAGAGTVAAAALNTGRRAVLCEIHKHNCDLIMERLTCNT